MYLHVKPALQRCHRFPIIHPLNSILLDYIIDIDTCEDSDEHPA